MMHQNLVAVLTKNRGQFKAVVPFKKERDKMLALDLSSDNPALDATVFSHTENFSGYIKTMLEDAKATYGIGGYLENRQLYRRSALFETLKTSKKTFDRIYMPASRPDILPVADEAGSQRTVHLGVDIWGAAGTPVFAPWGGSVHSFGFNNQFGDYGATIILQHQLDGLVFHSLYGHLSRADLAISENQYIAIGETIGHFGPPEENGQWPPHLHFQLIVDMELRSGDYPGVCHVSDLPYYEKNCPDPDLMLNMRHLAKNT